MSLLSHIPFQPWCTSCVKGKTQAEPHKRTERIIKDSDLPVIQCDHLMLTDVAGSNGLVCESIRVRHVHSCRNEMPNRHVRNNVGSEKVELLWTLLTSFCSEILSHRSSSGEKMSSPNDQNEQSFEVLPDGHIRATEELKNHQKQLQGQVRTMLAAMQERTHYSPTADSALMRWNHRIGCGGRHSLGPGRHEQVETKLSRREREMLDEGEEIRSQKRKVLRVES